MPGKNSSPEAGMFHILETEPSAKKAKAEDYACAWDRIMQKYISLIEKNGKDYTLPELKAEEPDFFRKIMFLWIRFSTSRLSKLKDETTQSVLSAYLFQRTADQMLGLFTPREFTLLYPVKKNSYKKECTNHHAKGERIAKTGHMENDSLLEYDMKMIDQPIGMDVMDFLWSYNNPEIFRYAMFRFCLTNEIFLRYSGNSPVSEFSAGEHGKVTLGYTEQRTGKNIKLELDSEGRVAEPETGNKRIPGYLHLIK